MKRVCGDEGLSAEPKDSEEVARLKRQVEKLNAEVEDFKGTIEDVNVRIRDHNRELEDDDVNDLEFIRLCEYCAHETDWSRGYHQHADSFCSNGSCQTRMPCKRWCVDVNGAEIRRCSACKTVQVCDKCTICGSCKKRNK
jgi:hypothetical protein